MTKLTLLPGRPFPLGAHPDGKGANFALFSEHAEKVELCLFSPDGSKEVTRLALAHGAGGIWSGYLDGVQPGLLYGYRVSGPYAPHEGHRFNACKLLVDPYARALSGRIVNHEANFGFIMGDDREDLSFDDRDNAAYMPKAILTAPLRKDEAEFEPPLTPLAQSILYEIHIRGATMLRHDLPARLRGTYEGLASDAMLRHFQDLGITAVELMPVFAFADEPHLGRNGLRNYWGYNPYCFFAPETLYGTGDAVAGFREMVRRFHGAGIEVILDVVYNHTAEGGAMGPTFSLKGIDNASYYALMPGDKRHYVNYTGCGNTLNISHPRVLQMVMDSLRYWVAEMGVDGFRFDLGLTLARGPAGFDPHAPLFTAIDQDPVLAGTKLFTEPWDLGPGGYQLGGFPARWSEWNDRYRDTIRAFWRGERGVTGELASRVTGSQDLFSHRTPQASLNAITAHDGFTLADLVSYEKKHNEANREGNRDGTDHNLSQNGGVEGETSNLEIQKYRQRQKRNLVATLLLSQGVPMLLGGDELGRSQGGNNNAYCQDNETSWLDWSMAGPDDRAFYAFVKTMIAIRKDHDIFLRTDFFSGEPKHSGLKDISWWSKDGHELTGADWDNPQLCCFGFHLDGTGDGSHLLVLLNAHDSPAEFQLPAICAEDNWTCLVDTFAGTRDSALKTVSGTSSYLLNPHTLAILAAEGGGTGHD
jgi:glycogen operon protein